jgi:RimJ/RimL family protein N-acetyltransferase
MIKLVPLDYDQEKHIQWLYHVRTLPEVAIYFFAQPPLTFNDHLEFLARCKQTQERQFFIIYAQEQMAGYCQIVHRPDALEVGLALHPSWQGKGMGAASIHLLLDYIKSCQSEKEIVLIVKRDNLRAIKLYEKQGFVILNDCGNELLMKYAN